MLGSDVDGLQIHKIDNSLPKLVRFCGGLNNTFKVKSHILGEFETSTSSKNHF